MSGLSDTAWETLAAEIDGEPVAEPSPAEPESPEALVQTEPESAAPDVIEDAPAVEASEAIATAESRLAEIEAREAALAQAEQAKAEKDRQVAAQWQAWREQEAEKQSSAYYQELEQVDPDLAKTYLGMRQGIVQQRREAEGRAQGAEHGLTAAMVALEQVVTPEQFQRVLSLTEHLVAYPDAVQMQSAIQQERQRTQSASAEKAALEKTILELRSQLEATSRPALADAVDGAASGAGIGTRIEDAPDFDTFFVRLTGNLPSTWQ